MTSLPSTSASSCCEPPGSVTWSALNSLTAQAARFLEAAVLAGLNIVVAGGTQAGKTTMLNCLAAAVPGQDRIISAEEVFELRFVHPDWVAMQTRQAGLEGTGEVTLRDLVRESLRMRPTRIVVGEVRSAECLDLLLALNAGLPGMATIHANSAREALVKLCTLPLLAGENISARFVVPTVAASVDVVVHLGIDAQGVRRVNEIVAVPGRVEQDIIETEPLFVRRGERLTRACGDAEQARGVRARGHGHSRAVESRRLMGALVGLGVGVGLLLIWSAFAVPHRPPARAHRAAASPHCCERGPGRGEPDRLRDGLRGVRIGDVPGSPGGVAHPPGRARLRADRRLCADRGGPGPGPSTVAGVRRGLARGRGQPGFGRQGGHGAPGSIVCAGRSWSGAACARRSRASLSTTR